MKLIDLLVKKTKEEGWVWPGESTLCYQTNQEDGSITKFLDRNLVMVADYYWGNCDDASEFNWLTKSQYESALAASEGWIEWHGGDCPVDSDAIVEVKYRSPNPYQYNNDRAGDFAWSHTGSDGDIIAYRVHTPDANSLANDGRLEQDLNECIGQGVTSEWDGEGLPPVGCECEVKRAIDWVKCKILFISESHVVLMADEECCWNTYACQFRPLRTEAERKRDAAINDMLTIIDCNGVDPKNSAIQIYNAIAAGKIPGVKLEVK